MEDVERGRGGTIRNSKSEKKMIHVNNSIQWDTVDGDNEKEIKIDENDFRMIAKSMNVISLRRKFLKEGPSKIAKTKEYKTTNINSYSR